MNMNFKNVFKQNSRLMVKHDENKIIQNLASRVRRVKSTVMQENKFYEDLLKKRKKKEQNFINIPTRLNTDIAEEGNNSLEKYIDDRIGVTEVSEQVHSINYALPLEKVIKTSARESPNHFLLRPTKITADGVQSHFQTPFSSSRRYSYRAKSSQRGASSNASHFENENIKSQLQRGTSSNASHFENENLKSQLVSKNLELESLKSELKDWWHEDFKAASKEKKSSTNKLPLKEITTALKPISDFNNVDPYFKIGPRAITSNTGVRAETQRVSSAPRKRSITGVEDIKKPNIPKPNVKTVLKDIEPLTLANKKLNIKRSSTPQNPNATRPDSSIKPENVTPLSQRNRNLKFKISSICDQNHRRNFRYENVDNLENEIDVIVEREEIVSPDFNKKFSIVNFDDMDDLVRIKKDSKMNTIQSVKTETESPQREMTSKILMRQSKIFI